MEKRLQLLKLIISAVIVAAAVLLLKVLPAANVMYHI